MVQKAALIIISMDNQIDYNDSYQIVIDQIVAQKRRGKIARLTL